MIQLADVSVQRGTKVLLSHTALTVYPGHKMGIIGPNGCGKTSLFKVLTGELQVDTGECRIPSNWEVAHMAQEISDHEASALDYVLGGDDEWSELQCKIESGHYDGEHLATLFEQFEAIDGYSAPARAQQLLFGLGFSDATHQKNVSAFSGGWRIRLNLARALMCRSDLLLLDEPTNHLDLDACMWLERWLQSYPGTLIIISHDRDFLDNVVNGIISFENQAIVTYSGNYTAYERQKAERLAQQEAAFNKQQERIKEIEGFVRRFRAKASKAKQAQSRLKELERMETIAPAHVDSPFSFRFLEPEKLPQQLMTIKHAAIGYGQTPILNEVNLSLFGDTRVALLGANGAGKTTLIKALADALPLAEGERVEGANLKVGYFAQHQLEALDLKASCYLHLQRLTPSATEQSIRNFLGGFDFKGDRAFEAIEHFSGGEKARLALAILAWQKPNLLLLDEPTNHLDIEMREALTYALQQFEGAIVMISHDRHLIKNTVDQFYRVDHGAVELFEGDLDDYYNTLQQNGNPAAGKSKTGGQGAGGKKGARKSAAQTREQVKPLTNAIKKLESDMEKTQKKLTSVEADLAQPDLYEGSSEQLQKLIERQAQLKATLGELEEAWLSKTEELEELK